MNGVRHIHRTIAAGLAVFLVLHLANHLVIFAGAEAHLRVMQALRILYRHPLVEWPMLAALAVQLVIGLRMAWRRGWPRTGWLRLQTVTGVLLAVFLIQHVGAAIATRITGLDTDTYWAASVVSRAPFVWYFAPYYALGVWALFAHLGAHRRSRALVAAGAIAGVGIVAGFMGYASDVTLPPANQAYLDDYWF